MPAPLSLVPSTPRGRHRDRLLALVVGALLAAMAAAPFLLTLPG